VQYVVYSKPLRADSPTEDFKSLDALGDAQQFAAQQVKGDVYMAAVLEIDVDDARKAISAVLRGHHGDPLLICRKDSLPGIDRPLTTD
jgi:hypothetical protein